jgi:hypothetical protein
MTTLINNLNEQLFTELTSAEGEVIQGGKNFTGYDYVSADKNRVVAEADFALPTIPRGDNEMDYVYIQSGTWKLYADANYKGNYISLGAGYHELKNYKIRVGPSQASDSLVPANNVISSLKKND